MAGRTVFITLHLLVTLSLLPSAAWATECVVAPTGNDVAAGSPATPWKTRQHAADFVEWRNTFGQVVTPHSGADGDGSGLIDAADYARWRANFGAAGSEFSTNIAAVPEPGMSLWLAGAMLCLSARWRALPPKLARVEFHRHPATILPHRPAAVVAIGYHESCRRAASLISVQSCLA